MLKQPFSAILFSLLLIGILPSSTVHADKLFGSGASNSLEISGPEFLPVEQAYQLDATFTGEDDITLKWTIAPSYYLYQHRFKFFDSRNRQLNPKALYQTGTFKYDDYYEKELEVFYGSTTIKLPTNELPGTLYVESQACADAGLCYPPRRQQLQINHSTQHIQVLDTATVAQTSTELTASTSAPLGLILLFALIGGAILNLMPCVFPVLSIKALSMANSSLNRHSKHTHGLVYTLGVISTFVVVAALLIALRTAGSAIGWGFQLQSPLFIGALVYLFVLMGFGFSGFFEFGTRLMSIGQSATTGNSLPATFMTGVLATVVASPCTAPFMGTALGFALTQSTPVALLVFVFLGLGMALPFLLLSWWPWLAEKMPQPGPWMDRFKQFLAFPLYLSALWLLWVLGHQTDINTVVALLIGVVMISFAIWLTHDRNGSFRAIKFILVLALIAGAVALPLNSYRDYQQARSGSTAWQPYTAARFEALRNNSQPVFINLTADWCITCLANEKLALSSEAFQQALKDKQIHYLKGDWTNYSPQITALLNRNGRNSVPLYLLYSANSDQPMILPQLLTESIVLEALQTIE